MAYPKNLLISGEEVVLDLRPHWWFLTPRALVSVAALIVGIVVYVQTDSGGNVDAANRVQRCRTRCDGGSTSPDNLGALCVRHHQLKTHAGWQITHSRPDGSCEWTSPHGRVYEHAPPAY